MNPRESKHYASPVALSPEKLQQELEIAEHRQASLQEKYDSNSYSGHPEEMLISLDNVSDDIRDLKEMLSRAELS